MMFRSRPWFSLESSIETLSSSSSVGSWLLYWKGGAFEDLSGALPPSIMIRFELEECWLK
jgi:hypothetical protein